MSANRVIQQRIDIPHRHRVIVAERNRRRAKGHRHAGWLAPKPNERVRGDAASAHAQPPNPMPDPRILIHRNAALSPQPRNHEYVALVHSDVRRTVPRRGC